MKGFNTDVFWIVKFKPTETLHAWNNGIKEAFNGKSNSLFKKKNWYALNNQQTKYLKFSKKHLILKKIILLSVQKCGIN